MDNTMDCKCDGCMACKANGGCDMEMCQGHEDMSKNYISDDEHLDKWNNLEKACWSGYKQVGMKDKNGKQVPNCVPVNKATGLPEESPVTWGGFFGGKFGSGHSR
jgi:hypothetical protein